MEVFDDPHLRSEFREGENVRAGDAAMRHIADNRDAQSGEAHSPAADGVQVEQSLCRMFMPPVTGIDDRRLDAPRQGLCGAG